MSRLYGRSRLVQTLYEKQEFENELANLDKTEWYNVNSELLSPLLQRTFIQLGPDQESEQFLDYCRDTSDSLCLQIFYDLASAVLSLFYTKTCINGILGRGIMFIFSTAHLSRLLFDHCNSNVVNDGCNPSIPSFAATGRVMLDLGAGDGNITEKFRPFFDTIYATETSSVMQRRLRDRGMKILSIDDWWKTDDSTPRFDLISCLNLLDRHTEPLTLLRQLRDKAKSDNALVLIAVVLPWNQYVEYQVGNNSEKGSNRPKEAVVLNGNTFEAQAKEFVEKMLNPSGFELLKWTRLPYLCEGDLNRSLYWLDDAVFVVRPL